MNTLQLIMLTIIENQFDARCQSSNFKIKIHGRCCAGPVKMSVRGMAASHIVPIYSPHDSLICDRKELFLLKHNGFFRLVKTLEG